MTSIQIPYKSHSNKLVWDYMTQASSQVNNINFADNLNSTEANYDNVVYLVFNSKHIYMFLALSQRDEDNNYKHYTDIWAELQDVNLNNLNIKETECKIYSLDIKKYNSVISYTEDYSTRDKIKLLVDDATNKLYYSVLDTDYVDLSPIVISYELRKKITDSFNSYLKNTRSDFICPPEDILTVTSVDKNSFLLPSMSYRDFLNFATYSCDNESFIFKDNNGILNFIDCLIDNKNELKFYLKLILRQDKFDFICDTQEDIIKVPVGLWQILVILQHYKQWQKLKYYMKPTMENGKYDNIVKLYFNDDTYILHILKYNHSKAISSQYEPDLNNFKLVGKLQSTDLFKLNKLYSNANRTCYFDFSTQTFTGNNYVFSDQKLDIKTVDLNTKIEAELPLKITFTEIKHYIGSDLSQKAFVLKVFTDGIRVMFERWNQDETSMECRVIFNHAMSKKNQSLNTV